MARLRSAYFDLPTSLRAGPPRKFSTGTMSRASKIVEQGRPWSFDGDGALFRLVSEAYRIRLAHLFDPVLAVHTSLVEPLPHQITAVYEAMLPRQPLRFLLADDPGAGKTIMAGLLMKELVARGDLRRCLVVCPGSLAEQWQDELYRRFNLPFEILTNDKLDAARTGNWFLENDLAIARLDKLARNEDLQDKLGATRLSLRSRRLRRSAQDVGNLLRWRGEIHQTLQTWAIVIQAHSSLSVDDGHAAQRQGNRLSTVPRPFGRRPIRRPIPGRHSPGGRFRFDAAYGEREPAEVRWTATCSRSASRIQCHTS